MRAISLPAKYCVPVVALSGKIDTGSRPMNDFDVTDSYILEFDEKGNFSLQLKSGTLLSGSVSENSLGDFRYHFQAWDKSGRIASEQSGNFDDQSIAQSYVRSMARFTINKEEPLGSPVNWMNSDLVDLLMEQERIILCPVCMGMDTEEVCLACKGSNWISSNDLERYVDFSDDSV